MSNDDYVVGRAYGEMAPNQSSIYEALLERAQRERDEAREALEIATDQLVQAQAALREIHTIVQLRFAEWAPANDMNDGREEAAK